MAYFAEIDSTNIVMQVIAVNNVDVDNLPFPASEPVGQAFIASLGIEGTWLQTSYNGNFRVNYAGIGYIYDATLGEYGTFVDPNPTPINPPDPTYETLNS
jgi:hypothetical protein